MEAVIRQYVVKDLKGIDKKWSFKIVDFLENIQDTDYKNL
jgi:hypothetical protein